MFTNSIFRYINRLKIYHKQVYHKSINLHRFSSTNSNDPNEAIRRLKIKSTLYYVTAAGVLAVGLSYAAVPLYRMFCQAYSYGGTTGAQHDGSKVESMKRISDRIIKIKFNADIGASMRWNFKPQQYEIKVSSNLFCFTVNN